MITEAWIRRLVLEEIERALDAYECADATLSAEAAARFLGVDRKTVYEYANRGVIPHRRLGKRLLFSRAALVSWLDHASLRRPGKGNRYAGTT